MQDKERREEEYSLDDIMQEFRKPEDVPQENARVSAEAMEEDILAAAEAVDGELQTEEEIAEEVSLDEVETKVKQEVSTDTIRLDAPELLHGEAHNAQHIDDEDEPTEVPQPK